MMRNCVWNFTQEYSTRLFVSYKSIYMTLQFAIISTIMVEKVGHIFHVYVCLRNFFGENTINDSNG